jgi:hypothetical protein
VVLLTATVLSRAWCLYELAVRRERRRRSELVAARSPGGGEGGDGGPAAAGPWGMVKVICWRGLGVGSLPLWVSYFALRLFWGIDMTKAGTIGAVFSGANAVTFGLGCGRPFYQEMQAFAQSDKDAIRRKIDDAFRSETTFDATISAATARSVCGGAEHAALLWLEAALLLAGLPVHAACGVVSLILTALWACCSLSLGGRGFVDEEDESGFEADLKMSRPAASFVWRWYLIDVLSKLLLLGPLYLAVAVLWAPFFAVALSPRLCRRRGPATPAAD